MNESNHKINAPPEEEQYYSHHMMSVNGTTVPSEN
jgi:hypothetical protein